MASLIKSKTAKGITYFIQLSTGEHEARPKISLGKCNKSDANTAKGHVEKLVRGVTMDAVTTLWVDKLMPSIRKRLEKLDLLEPLAKKECFTVAQWCDRYIDLRKKDRSTKADTVRKLQNTAKRLKTFFPTERLDEVNQFTAKSFRSYLTGTVGLAENTARRQIGMARQFYNAAIESKLVTENPFRGQPVTVRPNPARFHFITPETAQKVLDACPDTQWRLIFGLARFGGVRCPSEVLRLKWEDIDFEREQFTVHASKTEHHGNGGVRTVPIFPELKPLFQEAFEQAEDGTVYCITRYRDKGVNLRTHMNKIIKRAGLEPWAKTFQNLRSTRETELFKLTGGNIKAVCTWIGNSPEVALKHYAQITEADSREAAKLTVMNSGKKTVQNPVHVVQKTVQTATANDSKRLHEIKDRNSIKCGFCGENAEKTKACDSLRIAGLMYQMGWAGFEPAKAYANGFTARPRKHTKPYRQRTYRKQAS